MDDTKLLSAYVQTRSPDALTQLIERHIDFVYASALRQVRNVALAEDVTQAVFIIFTRKAASTRPTSLTGWLFNTTRHCAANARRAELRRRRHERQAAKPEVQMQLDDSAPASLDHALARLRHDDRQVVLLRYLQQREFADVSSILGISEQTARQRLSRAIERLRKLLSVGGQIAPSAVVVQTLTTATSKAPAHLSGLVIAATSNVVTTSTAAALATKTIHVMNWIKLKIAATILLAAVVAGTSSVAVVKAIDAQSTVTDNSIPPTVPVAAPAVTPAAPEPTAIVPAAGTVATFSDGMRVEVIGVAPSPIRGQKWWRPDGSPLPQPPIRQEYGIVDDPLCKVYTFVLKVTGGDPSSDTGAYVDGSHESASTDQGDLLCLTDALTKNPTATIDLICATGAWQTRAIISADALYTTGVNLNGVVFAPGNDPKTNTVKLTADYASMNALFTGAAEFVAVDLNGKIVSSSSMRGQGSLLTVNKTYTFDKLRPDQIKEFRIRSRPYNRTAAFRNISLIPGQLTTPTVEQHDTGKFVATFAAGGSVEVVGITTWPPTGHWWQPDGTPLDQIPPDYGPYTGPDAKSGEQAYALAYKWTDPPGNPSWSWTFPTARGFGMKNGTRGVVVGDPDVFRVILPADDKTMTFRAGLAGPWHQWPTVITTVAASVSIDNATISLSAPTEKPDGVVVTVKDNLQRDLQRYLVAIDTSGVAHIVDPFDTNYMDGTTTFRFPQITKAQIKSYQLQTRLYEYINFKGLSLKPGQHSEVTIEPDVPTSPTAPPKPAGEEGL